MSRETEIYFSLCAFHTLLYLVAKACVLTCVACGASLLYLDEECVAVAIDPYFFYCLRVA